MPIKSSPDPQQQAPRLQPAEVPARIRRQQSRGMDLVEIKTPFLTELHLTVTPGDEESAISLSRRVAELLQTYNATIVRLLVFGSVKAYAHTIAALRQSLEDPELPVTWVEGAACHRHPIAGMQIHAVAGTPVRTAKYSQQACARLWSDTISTHCVLGGVEPTCHASSRPEQARETIEALQTGLVQAGMSMKNLARTWFFLDDILSWYGDFNRVRNDSFARTELRSASVPASTGVNGRNPAGAAVALTAWAVQSCDPACESVHIVPSPRQCPAPAYGSAFSRAVEIRSPGFRQLLISGTASIEPGGHTAHVGDVPAQVELTMEVVEAILASRDMSFAEVSRATAYYRSGADAAIFSDWLERHKLRGMPVVHACCNICRDDLLFEIELDAVRTGSFQTGNTR